MAKSPKPTEKLQKVLANAGLASRREIERWITQGRVTVDGVRANIGDRVHLKQSIAVDRRVIRLTEQQPTQVLMYHKPIGEICSRQDPQNRPTVFENLPSLPHGRWLSVGRLDINTSGLLLFTNDGALAHQLMHPKSQIEREYLVRISGRVDVEVLERLAQGVVLDDGPARFEHIVEMGGKGVNHWYAVVVMEGRNRLVRRLWQSQGFSVNRLKRVRFGPIFLEQSLKPGCYELLTENQLQQLTALQK